MNSRTQRARSSDGCLALDACAAGFEPRPMLGWHVLRRECLAPVFLKPLFVVLNAHQNKARFLVLRRRGVCHFSYLALMIWKSRLAAREMDRYRISLTMSSAARVWTACIVSHKSAWVYFQVPRGPSGFLTMANHHSAWTGQELEVGVKWKLRLWQTRPDRTLEDANLYRQDQLTVES